MIKHRHSLYTSLDAFVGILEITVYKDAMRWTVSIYPLIKKGIDFSWKITSREKTLNLKGNAINGSNLIIVFRATGPS